MAKLDELENRMSALEELLKDIKDEIRNRKNEEVNSESSKQHKREFALTETERNKINDIMKDFDFKRVHDVMSYLDWKWAGCGSEKCGVPSVEKIKEEARRLLVDAAYEKTNIATGGLRAVYERDGAHDDDPYIGLEFIVEECEGFDE